MFKVRIPFISRTVDGQPLQWVLEETAKQCDMTPHDVMIVITHVLENIARALTKGWIVRIPGFGMFGPYTWWPRKAGSHEPDKTKAAHVLPRFVAAKGFVSEIDVSCRPSEERNKKLDVYRKNHAYYSKATPDDRRVFTAMSKFRESVVADKRKLGMDDKMFKVRQSALKNMEHL